jgi:vancomycin resistance protein YoaR
MTSTDATRRPRRRRFPFFRLITAFLVGIVLAGALGAGALYAYDNHYASRVLPGVSVGPVDLSGLDRKAAGARLAQAYASFGQGRLVVRLGDEETAIPYADLGRGADIDAMLDEAFGVGRTDSTLQRVVHEMRLLTTGTVLMPRMRFEPSEVVERITEIARANEWRAVDAKTIRTETGFSTAAGKFGQRVDERAAILDAIDALTRATAPSQVVVTLDTISIEPSITTGEAESARARAAAMAQAVTITSGDERWTVPAKAIHRAISFKRTPDTINPVVNPKLILAAVKPLAKDIERDAVDATFTYNKATAKFSVVKSQDGRTFDPAKTADAVYAVVAARSSAFPPARVAPVLTAVKPELDTKAAQAAIKSMKKVSTWTTRYIVGESNGFGANIRIPTSILDGYVVGPGETFDFWTAIGPVTRAKGYRDGGAIIDGRTQPTGALAGGICSCSTTLFNAALRAGYDIVERANHYYYINRYPLGLDATVLIRNGAVTSMKWKNDTKFPVLIRGYNGSNWTRFDLITVPLGRTVTFSQPTVRNVRQAKTVTEFTSSLPPGVRKQIEAEHDGMDVWVTRTVTDDKTKKVVHKETFGSHYGVVNGVILIGKSNAPAENTKPSTDGGTTAGD